jgi:hypothetical protein
MDGVTIVRLILFHRSALRCLLILARRNINYLLLVNQRLAKHGSELVHLGNGVNIKVCGDLGELLGGEGFVERVRGRIGKVAREHPRYERATVEIGPQEIIRIVARMY